MISKEEFEKLVNNLKEKLDETTSALVTEEILAILSSFNTNVDELEKVTSENETLKNDKEELLKVNGKLYQKIGFEDKTEEEKVNDEKTEDEIKVEDVIDEKGEII